MIQELHTAPRRPVPDYTPPTLPLEVIYKDENVLVLNKPSGLLTVPGMQPGAHDCLESRAQNEFPSARIVHRLDWDTSGVLIMGLTAEARVHLGLQFEKRQVKKTYIARVWGTPSNDSGTINLPLRCDWPNRPRQMVDHEQGREAITDWQIMTKDEQTSDLMMKPHTGRSHQLRVHCLSMGHPILGDRLYAHEQAYHAHERMCLHAFSIAFAHPVSGESLYFESEVPF